MSELVDKDAFLKQERKWYCENCDRRKGVKNGRKCFVYEIGEVPCRACDVDDVLDDLEDFPTAFPWHRLEEEPKEEKRYLVWEANGFAYCDAWKEGKWQVASTVPGTHITHWMPIEPPKEVQEWK